MSGATIVLIALLLLAIVTAARGIRTVPQGQVWTVERFGAFTRLLQPGLNFLIPFIDNVGHKLNVQEVVLDIPEQSVITKDNATVVVDGIVYYRVMDPAKAAYQVQNLQQALNALAMTNIRAVIGEMDLDATLSSRERINSSLLAILDGATDPWGVKVSRVELRKVEPPENLVRAMNLQMTAERERRATVMKAEGDRAAAIQRAEGEKQALVLQAEGRQQAAMRDAEARERLAEAEARATEMVAAAAAGAGGDALRYFIADKYVKAFEALAANPSSKLVVVPMEASAMAGGITQAMELLRQGPPASGAAPTGANPWNRG
jgi:regulator of protease activity HflC (stomatin/prohibitin superfamily)